MNQALNIYNLANPNEIKDAVKTFLRANGVTEGDLAKSIAQLSYFDQKSFAGVTNVPMFTGTFNTNNSNLGDSYIRPQGEHMVIQRLRFLEYVGANPIQNAAWNYGLTQEEFVNGTFTIQSNGVVFVRDMPMTVNPNSTDETLGFLELPIPIFWAAQTKIEVSISLKTVGIATSNIRVELHGMGTVS